MPEKTFFQEHPNFVRNAIIALIILVMLWFIGQNSIKEATAIQAAHNYILEKYYSAPGQEAPRFSWRTYNNMDGTFLVSATPPIGTEDPKKPGTAASYSLLIRVKDWKVISEGPITTKE
jgi:hypothetical protein